MEYILILLAQVIPFGLGWLFAKLCRGCWVTLMVAISALPLALISGTVAGFGMFYILTLSGGIGNGSYLPGFVSSVVKTALSAATITYAIGYISAFVGVRLARTGQLVGLESDEE